MCLYMCVCVSVVMCVCVCVSIDWRAAYRREGKPPESCTYPVPESERKRLSVAEQGAAQENTWENKQRPEEGRGRRGRAEEG